MGDGRRIREDRGQGKGESELEGRMLIRLMFVIWIGTITVLAVVPHADDGLMVSSNVTSSGMEDG